jgi:serine/threonine protein phosphatase PrpC
MKLFGLGRPRTPLRAAMCSHPGKVRQQNQDACLLATERGLFAVADGIGGRPAGDVAARMAVDRLPGVLARARRRAWPGRVGQALGHAVSELSGLVRARAASDPSLDGMGTTLVLALVSGGTAHLAHVGDSRAYLMRAARLRPLTVDHCLAREMARDGLMDSETASAHPFGHALTRALGMPGNVRAEVAQVDLAQGDRLLLCSDGLTKMVAEAEIAALLEARPEPSDACQALVDAANDAGGYDNISAVVVDVLPAGDRPPAATPPADAADGVDVAARPSAVQRG